jgi:hypothetical protein
VSALRRRSGIGALAIALAFVIACAGGGAGSATGTWNAQAISESTAKSGMQPILVNSNLGVGDTRMAFGLFKGDGSMVDGAKIAVHLFRLAPDPEKQPAVAQAAGDLTPNPVSLVQSLDHLHPDGTMHIHVGGKKTMYVAQTNLDRAGEWGASLDVTVDGKSYNGMRLRFTVQPHTSEPAVGDPAPKSEQATTANAALADIDSTLPPNEGLHNQTIAAALAKGRPVVVAFATPAFCQTQFCGPVVENVLVPVWKQYAARAEFVHIEPYDLKRAREGALAPTPVTDEWKLLSEPFVFVIDAKGRVAAKFEGIVESGELTAALDKVRAAP